MCRSKSPLFRYNCRKNCQLASAKLTVFCFILTKNRQILSALQFLLSCFIRISEKKFLAYLPYSRDFLSLRRMKERCKNRHLFIEGAPYPVFFTAAGSRQPAVGRFAERTVFSIIMQGFALPPLNASTCQGRCRQSRRRGSYIMQGGRLAREASSF